METEQSSANQNPTRSEVQPQQTGSNQKLFVAVVISVLLTVITSSTAVYFWQKSLNKEKISSMEQKISSLEKQVSTMRKEEVVPQPIDSSPSVVLSPEQLQNNQKPPQTPTLSPVNGAKLSEIKYTLPDGWEAKIRPDQNDLFLSPKEEGGFLAIKVYASDGKTGRREYYCQLSGFCIDSSYFTPMQLGNISGYKANALDNSGGGPEYFGAKGDKFYIISSFSPSYPPNNFFDKTFQQVLDSLIF